MKKKICFVLDNDPNFLGGTAIYFRNLLKYAGGFFEASNLEVTCLYPGGEEKEYVQDKIKYRSIKTYDNYPIKFFIYAKKVSKYLEENRQDLINSHALGGYFLNFFNKEKEIVVHTYHGVTYHFFKNHLERPLSIEKILAWPLMKISKILEEPPMKKADKIICVSEKVKREIQKLYGKNKNIKTINTGIDSEFFRPLNKTLCRKRLHLKKNLTYGLYVGRGGWWTKGLDRTIALSEEMSLINPKFRLVVCGPDERKCKSLLKKNKKLIIYKKLVMRKEMPLYFSACDVYLCCSRYEGNPLVLGEAMASGLLTTCSKDISTDYITDGKNGIVLTRFNREDALKILGILESPEKNKALISQALVFAKKNSLNKWANEYFKEILK